VGHVLGASRAFLLRRPGLDLTSPLTHHNPSSNEAARLDMAAPTRGLLFGSVLPTSTRLCLRPRVRQLRACLVATSLRFRLLHLALRLQLLQPIPDCSVALWLLLLLRRLVQLLQPLRVYCLVPTGPFRIHPAFRPRLRQVVQLLANCSVALLPRPNHLPRQPQLLRRSKTCASLGKDCLGNQFEGREYTHVLTSRLSYYGFIQVCVGQEGNRATFDIHQYLIATRSPLFKKATTGEWKEAQERLVKPPDDEPMTFQQYVHLLYPGKLAVVADPITGKNDGAEEMVRLAKLYVLAEKLQDVETKNMVIDAMLLSFRQVRSDGAIYCPGHNIVSLINAGTPSSSPMRVLMADLVAYRGESSWMAKKRAEWPSDFMADLALLLLDNRPWPAATDPTKQGDSSKYREVQGRQGA
jgi:hypothetical protein